MTKATYEVMRGSSSRYRVSVSDTLIGWVRLEPPRSDTAIAEEWSCEFPRGGSAGLFATRDDAVRRLIGAQLELQRRTNIPEDSEP